MTPSLALVSATRHSARLACPGTRLTPRRASRWPRLAFSFAAPFGLAASMVFLLGALGCGSNSDTGTSSPVGVDGGSDVSLDGSGGVNPDAAVALDAPQADAVEVGPVGDANSDGGSMGTDGGYPSPSECAWQPGTRPSATLPSEHSKAYVIELDKWSISNKKGDPVATRTGLNKAIKWATDNGFNRIVVPAGHYLVGESTSGNYQAGVELQADMTLDLSQGAVIEMAPNDKWNYCVLSVNGKSNITIRGGELIGDRSQHTYDAKGGGHDEGHGICVWTGVDRVLIENVQMRELTGDGVLIVGEKASKTSPERPSTNVTIRNNHIHHNRRQGVSIVGGHNIVVENNHIHHIQGTSPQFGIDIEGAGRSDKDILIYRNRFHDNAGGDFVTSSGRNAWFEENTSTQCQANDTGEYDPSLSCELKGQTDGPVIIWKETSNVIVNNTIRMMKGTSNGLWGILGYTGGDGPTRKNPVGNYIAGNTLHNAGIHLTNNRLYFVSKNVLNEGTLLGHKIACTRLEYNRLHRTKGQNYMFWWVAGFAVGNILNTTAGTPTDKDVVVEFPMADDAPYRNSSPVFW